MAEAILAAILDMAACFEVDESNLYTKKYSTTQPIEIGHHENKRVSKYKTGQMTLAKAIEGLTINQSVMCLCTYSP